MFCTACGGQLSDEHRFCPQCGKAVGVAPSAGAGTGTPPPPRVERKLVRPMDQKSIGGVCAGFANYLDVDVALMRIVWLCTAIFTGVGFIVYLVCWAVIPKEWNTPMPEQAAYQPPPPYTPAPPAEPEEGSAV